jgi:hypothetical protein
VSPLDEVDPLLNADNQVRGGNGSCFSS